MTQEEKPTIANAIKKFTSKEKTEQAIRELIEYHVTEALKAASENAKWSCETRDTFFGDLNRGDYDFESTGGDGDIYEVHSISVNKESILNSYPLTNIE